MKIDFKKLQKIEQSYMNNVVCINTLHTMVDIVLTSKSVLKDPNETLAFSTLKELGILIDETKKPEQINS